MTITIPTPSKHWLLYPILAGVAVFGFWLWRDTAAKDFKVMQALVDQAKTSQKAVDKQAVEEVNAANADLQKKNASLQKQLADAKTVLQQAQFINQQAGTHIEPPQATNPSLPDAPIPVSPQDLKQLAVKSEECAEDKNQVAASQITIETQKQQIAARDNTIVEQGQEIKSLKGSHLKRFLTATKHVGIGIAIGTAVGIIVEKNK